MHRGGHNPFGFGEWVLGIDAYKVAARQLEHAHTLSPSPADALGECRRQQCPCVVGVCRCVVVVGLYQSGVLACSPDEVCPAASIGAALATQGVYTLSQRDVGFAGQRVFLFEQGGHIGSEGSLSGAVGCEQHAGYAWMAWQLGHGFASRGSFALFVQRAEGDEQPAGVYYRCLRRRRQPWQGRHLALAPDGGVEQQRGEVGLEYLGLPLGLHSGFVGLAPHAIAHAGRHTSGTSGALGGHVKRDAHRLQVAQAAPGVEHHLAAQTAVNHYLYTLDGQRGFGDWRGQDHLALASRTRGYGPRLLIVGEQAVERTYRCSVQAPVKQLRRPAYFALARQKGQYVAFVAAVGLQYGFRHPPGYGGWVGCTYAVGMDYLNGKHLGIAMQKRTVQCLLQGCGAYGGRHRHHAQVVAQQLLALARQRKGFVGVQAPLVEFVEHHHPDAFQRGVVEQHARQHPFGDHLDACPLRHSALEAYAVAHRFAHGLVQQPCHARGNLACRHPSGLQHDDLASIFRQS